jgi:hypothetical protein
MRNTLLIILFFQRIVCFSQVNNAANARKNIASNSSSNYLDLNLTMGIPMDEFASTTSSLPFGFTLNYLHQPTNRLPFLYGGGFTYLSAGTNTINKTLTADITLGSVLIDQLRIPLEFNIRNQIVNGHLMMRIQGNHPTVKPYLDLLGGFNYFWTRTTLYDRSAENYFTTDDKDRIFQKNQLSRITWSAGIGLGICARLNKSTFLNLGGTYMLGGKLDYFDRNQINKWDIELNSSTVLSQNDKEGSLNSNNIDVDAFPKRSATNMLFAQAGVTFWLDAVESKKTGAKKTPIR